MCIYIYLCVYVPEEWIAVKYMPYFKKAELSLYKNTDSCTDLF